MKVGTSLFLQLSGTHKNRLSVLNTQRHKYKVTQKIVLNLCTGNKVIVTVCSCCISTVRSGALLCYRTGSIIMFRGFCRMWDICHLAFFYWSTELPTVWRVWRSPWIVLVTVGVLFTLTLFQSVRVKKIWSWIKVRFLFHNQTLKSICCCCCYSKHPETTGPAWLKLNQQPPT